MEKPKSPPTVQEVKYWSAILLTCTLILISIGIRNLLNLSSTSMIYQILANLGIHPSSSWKIIYLLIPLPFLIILIKWFFQYKVFSIGFKQALKDYLLVRSLRAELITAGRYSKSKFFGKEVSKLPKIKLSRLDDTLIVSIKNSLALNEPLNEWDISSALGDFIVEKQYLSKNRNYYNYTLLDTQSFERLIFHEY